MFTEEDFNLPLEKQLRIRVIDKEIEECTNVEVLQENLKQCSCTLMKYQHLLTVVLQKQVLANLSDFSALIDKIEGEVN